MYSIKKTEVLRYLGYNGQEISYEIDTLISELTKKAKNVCTPVYTHMISDIENTTSGLHLTGTDIFLTGNDILKHLNGASKCITFACTLGVGFESSLLRLQAQSVTKALIFDAVGTAFIEEFADITEETLLSPFIKDGYYSKFRYSPGYGDLSLDFQTKIINTLQCQKKIGLTVTDTNILIPRKSVTAFIGIFKTPQKKPNSKCELCTNKEMCRMRKDGKACD